MKTHLLTGAIALLMLALFAQCQNSSTTNYIKPRRCDTCISYAVFAEFARDSNKLMKNGLNRRVFNVTERMHGEDIKLNADGSVVLQPGTYRISGFSMVTMQTEMVSRYEAENFPGYCLVYPTQYEQDKNILKNQLCIGSPATSDQTAPSLYDFVYTCDTPSGICVGHQSGNDLPPGKIYLSVYKVDTTPSDYHVFARMAITRMY